MRLPIPRGRRAILIVGVPVGLAAAGIFVFTQVIAGSGGPVPDPGPGEHGVMIALDSRVVNLKVETAADYKYAKVAVTIEMRPTTASFYKMTGADRAKEEKAELSSYSDTVPLLQDALLQVLSSHTSSSLSTPQGMATLKAELLAAMRKSAGADKVLNVYFTDFKMD